jgi:hypothetical protein
MPFLLIIPLMVWTLSGGQTRLRLWRHTNIVRRRTSPFQVQLLRAKDIHAKSPGRHAASKEVLLQGREHFALMLAIQTRAPAMPFAPSRGNDRVRAISPRGADLLSELF